MYKLMIMIGILILFVVFDVIVSCILAYGILNMLDFILATSLATNTNIAILTLIFIITSCVRARYKKG